MSPSSPLAPDPKWAPDPPGPLKRTFIRVGLRLFLSAYLRVRVTGAEHIPRDRPYLLNFSHPSWIDPFLLIAYWPDKRLFIFGPKEEDMRRGWRNRLIAWGRYGVPFKPSRSDLLETTKRALAVYEAGYGLAVAGEGRLSDREGEIVPLQDGSAFFALRGKVPVVPLAIIGTRWLRFGKRVTLRIGPQLPVDGLKPNREGVVVLTERLQAAMEELLVGAVDEPPPGPFGRWLTNLFADRPWEDDPNFKL